MNSRVMEFRMFLSLPGSVWGIAQPATCGALGKLVCEYATVKSMHDRKEEAGMQDGGRYISEISV